MSHLEAERAALGHFNVSDLIMLNAVFAAAGRIRVPVLVGASEGEREFFGVRQLAAVCASNRRANELPAKTTSHWHDIWVFVQRLWGSTLLLDREQFEHVLLKEGKENCV